MDLPEKTIVWVKEVREMLRAGTRVIVFTGAGVSMAPPANVPGWKDTFLQLCDVADSFGKQHVSNRVKAVVDRTCYEPQYLTVAFDELRQSLGDTVYHREMQRILRPKSLSQFPSVISQLVRLPFWAYISTNLDALLEKAAIEAHSRGERDAPIRPYTEAVQVSQEVGQQLNGWLWKVHGSIDLPSSWIFTAEEYWRSIYANRYALHRQLLEHLAQGFHLLFVGFGGTDPDVDLHLDRVVEIFGGQQRRHMLLAREMSPEQKLTLAGRNIDVIEYQGPPDHSSLTDLLAVIGQRNNPSASTPHLDVLAIFSEWTRALSATVDLRRIAGVNWKKLAGRSVLVDEVFVDLFEQIRPTNLLRAERGESLARRSVAQAVLDIAYRGLALLGPSGCGKSTLLKRVTQILLKTPSAPLPICIRLQDVIGMRRQLDTSTLAPARRCAEEFLACVEKLLPAQVEKSGDLRRWVEARECLWLLDGLDELPEKDDQKWILNALDGMVNEWPNSHFILTSRPLEALGEYLPSAFDVINIDVLSDEQISELTEKWVDILLANIDVDERQSIIDQFILAFEGDQGFRQLSRSPVMLTSMILVQLTLRSGEELLRAKSEVLRSVVTWLLGTRVHRIKDRVLDIEQIERIYGYLAFFMLCNKNSADRRSIGLQEASNCLADYLDENSDHVMNFLATERDSGLLSFKWSGDICFSVDYFQYYLAASYLSFLPDDGVESWWTAAREFLFVNEWRDTFSLLPACLARRGRRRAELFFQNIAQKAADEPLAQQAHAYSVAALGCIPLRGIKLDSPSDGQWSVLHQSMKRLFTEDALTLPVEARVSAAVAHGWVCDERFSGMKNLWINIVGGDSVIGAQAASTTDPQYDALALPWEAPTRSVHIDSFEIHRFPVTVIEFDSFLLSGGYQNRNFWHNDGWKWILEERITTPGNWYRQLETPNTPVTELSFFEASAYCRWLSHQDPKYVVKLPSSEEWEFVARRSALQRKLENGTWDLGSGDASLVNWLGTELWEKCPVGLFPKSTSDDGVADLIGNVEEWCRDTWSTDLLDPEQEKGLGVAAKYGFRVVRGGSAIRAARLCRPTYFSRCKTEGRYPTIGFRPLRQIKITES